MNFFEMHAPADPDTALEHIPVIDLAPLLAGAPDAEAALGEALRHACETIGFFYIRGHGVPDSVIDGVFEQNRRFHALPMERKQRVSIDENNVGYLAMNASIQRHSTVHQATRPNQNESYFVGHDRGPDHPDVIAGRPICGRNRWPEDLPGFREAVMRYFSSLHALAQRMLPGFALALGMPRDWFSDLFSDENHVQLRLLHYPPTRIEDNDFGTGPHTDNSFMTILARMEVPGLAIQLPSGEWLAPPLIPGTFLVNIGNIMRRISNDRFLSTRHGVIVDGGKHRYSVAYFHSPDPYSTLEVAPSCVDAANPPRYEPAVYADLILDFWRANYAHQPGHASATIAARYD